MFAKRLIKNKEKAKRLVHIIAGITILLHSYEYYDNADQTYKLFLFAGLLFLTIAVLHPLIEKKAPWIDGVFFAIEGVLYFVVSFQFFHEGKKAIPSIYLIVGIFQFYVAYRFSNKGIKNHKINN